MYREVRKRVGMICLHYFQKWNMKNLVEYFFLVFFLLLNFFFYIIFLGLDNALMIVIFW